MVLSRRVLSWPLLMGAAALVGGGLCAPAQAADDKPLPVLPFRSAPHPDFDRIVFDAPASLSYRLIREGDSVRLDFSGPATVKLNDKGLTRLRGLAAQDEKGKLSIRFAIAAKALVKDFRNGPSVVVDVYGPAAPASASVAPAQAAAKEDPHFVIPEKPTTASDVPPKQPVAEPKKAEEEKPGAESAPVASDPPVPKTPETEKQASPPPAPEQASSKIVAEQAVTPTIKKAVAGADYPPLIVGNDSVLAATFDPRIPTGAAIYARGGYAVIVFDRKITLDPAALANGAPVRVRMEPLDLPRNSGFRFEIPVGTTVRATREGTAWQIYLTRQKTSIAVGTELVAQPDFALGARLIIPTTNAPDPVRMIDPIIGDTLILVPLRETIGFPHLRRMADVDFLSAAQGLVIKALHEKVITRLVPDGVEISAEGGMKMSPSRDRNSVVSSGKKTAVQRLFNLEGWRGRPKATFTETRQQLMQTIVDVPEPQKPLARLELSRFYFSHAMAEESLALLTVLEKQVPDLIEHPEYKALRGAARILAGQDEAGLQDLSAPELKDLPEIDLWQAVGAANQRKWPIAEQKFSLAKDILESYPEPFFSRIVVLAAEAALAVGKDDVTAQWLDMIEARKHDPQEDMAIKYLRGALAAKAGKADLANGLWKDVAKGQDRLYKIRAELGLVDLGIATHSLTPLQAIDKLEGLRFAWRGDELEIEILHRLGLFYFDAKNYKAGLTILQQAMRYYPNSPFTEPLRAEMKQMFKDLFLTDKGNGFSPVEALALNLEYKDLRPEGDEGNKVQLALAEKLVAIDLLDQASAIMTDLVKNSLKGEEKARIGTRLAAIRLLDHKPDQALAALDLTQAEALQSPADMQAERTVLRARALAEGKKYDEALALLQPLTTPFAKSLRADILMKASRWAEAAKALQDVAGPPPKAGETLSKEQADALLGGAVALSLAGDNGGLDRLAIDYGASMAGTAQGDAFRILSRPEKTIQTRDIAAAQSRLSEVDMFRGFLDSYRKKDGSKKDGDPKASKAP